LLNIKVNQPTLVNMCGYKLAKFHGNTLSLSENITESFSGASYLTHTVYEAEW